MPLFDLKVLNAALDQLESERGIPKEKIVEAVEDALAAAYKKDYGKRGQIIRAEFNPSSGDVDFSQIKTAVDETTVRIEDGADEDSGDPHSGERNENTSEKSAGGEGGVDDEEAKKPKFNPEHHILIEDARKMKRDAALGDELVFPLEMKDDYGRIAAQTAKQVIIQRIREAERVSVMDEFDRRRGEIVSGTVQRVERGNIYIDLGRVVGVLPRDEQIPGEHLKQGERVRAYLYTVDETARDVTLRLSRSHPKFLEKLFEAEVPEIANDVVTIQAIAREPGSRSKMAVYSADEHIDPVGSCVGQRGVRVATVTSEVGGERIDVIEWSEDPAQFIKNALSPAEISEIDLDEEDGRATVRVQPDQYSLAIGKGGQNARLAAKLTGWKIDIRETNGQQEMEVDEEGRKIAEVDETQVDETQEEPVGESASEKSAAAPEEDPKKEE